MQAYLAGLAAGERVAEALRTGALGPEMEPEPLGHILFDKETIELVTQLASHGNDLAAQYVARRRQTVIEEDLREPG